MQYISSVGAAQTAAHARINSPGTRWPSPIAWFDSPASLSYDATGWPWQPFMLSLPHLVVIFIVALVVFGPEKLPELARQLGKWTAEFRRVTGDLRSSFEDQMRQLERESAEIERKKRELAAQQATAAATQSSATQAAAILAGAPNKGATPESASATASIVHMPSESTPPSDTRATESDVPTPSTEPSATVSKSGAREDLVSVSAALATQAPSSETRALSVPHGAPAEIGKDPHGHA